jgi:single-strand DNA-binding protein
MKIAVVGRIQTGSYTNKDGVKVYTTDVVVEDQEFVESKSSQQQTQNDRPAPDPANMDSFMDIPDGLDDDVPFA